MFLPIEIEQSEVPKHKTDAHRVRNPTREYFSGRGFLEGHLYWTETHKRVDIWGKSITLGILLFQNELDALLKLKMSLGIQSASSAAHFVERSFRARIRLASKYYLTNGCRISSRLDRDRVLVGG